MKYLSKISAVLVLSLLIISCEGDKTVNKVFNTVERGAVFRSLEIASSSFNAFDDSSMFSITAEVEDHENGDLLDNVDVYISFTDNTLGGEGGGGLDASIDEQFYTTLDRSEFSVGPNGFPTITFALTLTEIADALGLNPGNYTGGDSFTIRFEINLTDGRRFSNDNTGATVAGGSFFRSPFIYTVNVNCVPLAPIPGDYIIEYIDLYGDGWNGGFITVTIDGESTNYSLDSGDFGEDIFNVPDGTVSLELTYTAGNWEAENIYTIYAPGDVIAASDGPGPLPGVIVLSLCP